jgi:hypothetical protein
MPYTTRIRTLEESYRLLDDQIFQLEKTGSADTDKIKKLQDAKYKYLNELRIMRRAQWDHDHERVDLDDDR